MFSLFCALTNQGACATCTEGGTQDSSTLHILATADLIIISFFKKRGAYTFNIKESWLVCVHLNSISMILSAWENLNIFLSSIIKRPEKCVTTYCYYHYHHYHFNRRVYSSPHSGATRTMTRIKRVLICFKRSRAWQAGRQTECQMFSDWNKSSERGGSLDLSTK